MFIIIIFRYTFIWFYKILMCFLLHYHLVEFCGLKIQKKLSNTPNPCILFYSRLQYYCKGLPWWLSDKESTCQCGLIPGSGNGKPTPLILSGNSHGQRSPAEYSPWDHKESERNQWLNTSIALCNIATLHVFLFKHSIFFSKRSF